MPLPFKLPFALKHTGVETFGGAIKVLEKTTNLHQLPLPQQLRSAVPKRIAEFQAGRYCAAQALGALGHTVQTLPMAEDRAPIWPEGTLGSITHGAGLAAAVAAQTERFLGLGLDIEARTHVEPGLFEHIASSAEYGRMRGNWDLQLSFTLLFSAKEAAYKALSPSVSRVMEFSELTLVRTSSEQLIFALTAEFSSARPVPTEIPVRFEIGGSSVCTLCALAHL